jgi:hypothetical protein
MGVSRPPVVVTGGFFFDQEQKTVASGAATTCTLDRRTIESHYVDVVTMRTGVCTSNAI